MLIVPYRPEVIGVTSHLTGKLDLHNTWLVGYLLGLAFAPLADFIEADMVKHYITLAIDHGFGIIDVNVPHYLDNISVMHPYSAIISETNLSQDDDGEEEEELQKVDQATDELAQYLWENYIE
jgi:hypothetical protein